MRLWGDGHAVAHNVDSHPQHSAKVGRWTLICIARLSQRWLHYCSLCQVPAHAEQPKCKMQKRCLACLTAWMSQLLLPLRCLHHKWLIIGIL